MATTAVDPFASIIGQDRAKEQLRAAANGPVHAYLFVGPRGAGKRRAASAFAGELVGDPDDRDRSRRLSLAESHPDLVIVEPEGNTFRKEEAEAVILAASRSPAEAGSKVIVIERFHDATAEAAAKLLKPIEEPPPSTRFILLAEEVAPEHVTIASRSTRVDFPAVPVSVIASSLRDRGVDPEVALAASNGSGGDVGRAELLATDKAFALRWSMWWEAPSRLDGSGYSVGELVDEIRTAIDEAQEPLEARHAAELVAMDEQEELTGTRGSGRRMLEIRHKREARLHRYDEWRMGLATLARRYGEAAVDGSGELEVFPKLNAAAEGLVFNPNEELWLTALLRDLPPIAGSR